jgi:hypothetical protein
MKKKRMPHFEREARIMASLTLAIVIIGIAVGIVVQGMLPVLR